MTLGRAFYWWFWSAEMCGTLTEQGIACHEAAFITGSVGTMRHGLIFVWCITQRGSLVFVIITVSTRLFVLKAPVLFAIWDILISKPAWLPRLPCLYPVCLFVLLEYTICPLGPGFFVKINHWRQLSPNPLPLCVLCQFLYSNWRLLKKFQKLTVSFRT